MKRRRLQLVLIVLVISLIGGWPWLRNALPPVSAPVWGQERAMEPMVHNEDKPCDSDGDGKGDTGYICDTNGDGTPDACYVCDTDGDGRANSCNYLCDTNGDHVPDSCDYLCDTTDDGVADNCNYQVDYDGDGKNDRCFTCDTNNNNHNNAGYRHASSWANLQNCSSVHQDPNYAVIPNGCGSNGGVNVSDDPADGPNNSFLGCCNAHDRGYSSCKVSKSTTDNRFRECMETTCDIAYDSGDNDFTQHQGCREWAEIYFLAVHQVGQGAYESAQLAACVGCCP